VKQVRRVAVLLAMTVVVCGPRAVPQDDSQQYVAKAKFLSVMPGFVEWPAATFKTPTAALQICVHGDFSFGTSLAELARSEMVGGHRMEVKWVRKEQDLAGCQLLFVSHSAAKRYDKILEAVKNSITLTIGEDPEFFKAGGMLCLQPAQNGVLFDVNLDAVRDGHLKLSSQLLALARHVVHGPDSARS
jgi:YfiR/HmsC-like